MKKGADTRHAPVSLSSFFPSFFSFSKLAPVSQLFRHKLYETRRIIFSACHLLLAPSFSGGGWGDSQEVLGVEIWIQAMGREVFVRGDKSRLG